jgi:hypothetical protein
MSCRSRIHIVVGLLLTALAKQTFAEPDKDGFVFLFDGKSLDGWSAEPHDTKADWSVRDKGMHVEFRGLQLKKTRPK